MLGSKTISVLAIQSMFYKSKMYRHISKSVQNKNWGAEMVYVNTKSCCTESCYKEVEVYIFSLSGLITYFNVFLQRQEDG